MLKMVSMTVKLVGNAIVYIHNLSRKFMLPCGRSKMADCVNKIEIMQISYVCFAHCCHVILLNPA